MHFPKIFSSKYLVLLFILFLIFTTNVNGSTYYSIASGNWTSSSSWSLTSGGSAISSGYPGVGDDVIIEDNKTITISNGDALFANNITIGSTTNGTLFYDGSGPATLTISNDLTIGGTTGAGTLNYGFSGLEIICNKLLKGNAAATRVNDYRQKFTFTGTFTLPSSFTVFEAIKINGGTVTLSNNLQINGNTSPYIYAGSTLDLKSYNLNIASWGVFSIYGTLIVGGPSNFPTGWTTLTIDPNSTVKYNYNGNKLIYPTNYGNLVIEGSGTYQSNRFISSVTVTNGGSGYTMFDEMMGNLTFSGGGGSGASARFRRNFNFFDPSGPSSIDNVQLENSGSGYTSAPTVSLTGTSGSGATFVANLSTGTYSALNTTFIASLNISTPIATLTSCSGSSSISPTTFDVIGSDLTASVTITVPSDFEISTSSNGTYTSSLTLTNTSTVSQTLYVRLNSSATAGGKTGTITATSTGASDATTSVSGTVNGIPTISIGKADVSGYFINDAIICNGASVTLTASGTTATYSWSTGESSTSITKSPTITTTYTVTATNSCFSNTASVTVSVNDLPTVGITETDVSGSVNNDSRICKGGSAIITATGDANSYLWSVIGGTSISNTISPLTNTTYTVTGTSAAGCSNITSVIITVEALPTLSLGSISLCTEATFLITNTTSMPVDNGWSVSGTITVNNGYITAGTTPGSYSVSYTDGCAQTASATVTVNNSDNGVTAITDGQASYKINNTNPIPQGPTASLYMGYNGFNYSSTTRPINTGFYRANNVSGSSAGCPYPFYIFRCTTCPD